MRRYVKPGHRRPPDFWRFWAETAAILDKTPADTHLVERPEWSTSEYRGYSVTFTSYGGARITGYALLHERARHLIVHSHGYGSRCEPRHNWASAGVNVLGVDIRGFGWSAEALAEPSRHGYVLTGIESPETSVLRGAVCDYVRATEVAASICPRPPSRTVAHGISFAGGLALMAQGLAGRADVLCVGVPTFGWADGRHFFVKAGSGAEISQYLSRRADMAEDVALVLRYFDSTAFAERVTAPALVGVGLQDDVVPAATVYAIANHLRGPHEVMEFPISHSDHPDEDLWQAFDDRCLSIALSGIDHKFGEHKRLPGG